MTTRPDTDAFGEAFKQGMTETRRPGGPVPGPGSPLADDIETAFHTALADARREAVEPWRRLFRWFAAGYAVMVVVSLVQLWLWWASR